MHKNTFNFTELFKEHIQMVNTDLKRCSTLLVISKMQIKTTVSRYYKFIRVINIKKFSEDCEGTDFAYNDGKNVWCDQLERFGNLQIEHTPNM